jgi:alpha,alpha-trehalase
MDVFSFFKKTRRRPAPPQKEFGSLFEIILTSGIFKDTKPFVDAPPKRAPREIVRAYRRAKKNPNFSLLDFLDEHFDLTEVKRLQNQTATEREVTLGIRDYIDTMWDVLSRKADVINPHSSLLPLPYPYVVPGGRFPEIYYWDSYFTMVGLKESGRIDLLEDMVQNFAYLIDTYGHIPNGTRSYMLSRSQPPFFSMMVRLLAEAKGTDVLQKYLPQLQAEYRYWMLGSAGMPWFFGVTNARLHVVRLSDGSVLNRYYDELDKPRDEMLADDIRVAGRRPKRKGIFRDLRAGAESGWDYSGRWFKDGMSLGTIRTTDIVPVDLNCLLYLLEQTLSQAYTYANDSPLARQYHDLATKRASAIRKHLYDEESGWFYDYSLTERKRVAYPTLAGVFPLWASIASPQEASRVAEKLIADFLRPGGLVTSLARTGEQWDAPNGWAPLQFVTAHGLQAYGYQDLAGLIAERWCTTVIRVYERYGSVLEKYNVENPESLAGGGEYDVQEGFGWTNGVLLYFLNTYRPFIGTNEEINTGS